MSPGARRLATLLCAGALVALPDDLAAQSEAGRASASTTGVTAARTANPVVDVPAIREAAERGSAQAQFDLAAALDCGRAVKRDRAAALDWLRRAAAQGHVAAQSALGWKYMTGNGVRRDDAEAFVWLERAAQSGNTAAQNNLGILYAQGRGVNADPVEAAKWFRLAADKGAVDAQRNLDRLRAGRSREAKRGIAASLPHG